MPGTSRARAATRFSASVPSARQRLQVHLGPAVDEDDHEVALLHVPQDRNEPLRGDDRILPFQAGPVPLRLPGRDVRRRHSEDADPDAADRLDEVLRKCRRAVGRVPRVRREPGEGGLLLRLAEHVEPVVELVIADGHGVVPDRAHRRRHRIGVVVRAARVEVLDGRALDRVSRVQKEHVRSLPADGLDPRGHAGEAFVGGLRAPVVPREKVTVEIRRLEDRHDDATFRGAGERGKARARRTRPELRGRARSDRPGFTWRES